MASDITKYLKEQFAGLFQSFLENQTRIREFDLIKNIENTSKTLNNLVELLKDENRDKDNEVNRILMINHPLIAELKKILKIPYNFYVEGLEDLYELLTARGFKLIEKDMDNYYYWKKSEKNRILNLKIIHEIFEKNILKYIKNEEWKELNIVYEEEIVDDDDFPF